MIGRSALLLALAAILAGTAAATASTGEPKQVRPPRAEITALLDRFVPEVLAGWNLRAGWELVNPSERGSRTQWLKGETPFQRYAAKPGHHNGWIVNYSYPGDVGFDVFLAPAKKTMVSYAFRGEAVKIAGKWRIKVFYPQASFQPPGKKQLVWADTDLQPKSVPSAFAEHGKLPAFAILLPLAAIFALLAALLAVLVAKGLRRRGRVRAIERELRAERLADGRT